MALWYGYHKTLFRGLQPTVVISSNSLIEKVIAEIANAGYPSGTRFAALHVAVSVA